MTENFEKVINSINRLSELSFDHLYFRRDVDEEKIRKLREECINSEEYEKVIILDSYIKKLDKIYNKESEEEIKDAKEITDWCIDNIYHLMTNTISFNGTEEELNKLVEENLNIIIEKSIEFSKNILDRRIEKVIQRQICPFDPSEKEYHYFEYYRKECYEKLLKFKKEL